MASNDAAPISAVVVGFLEDLMFIENKNVSSIKKLPVVSVIALCFNHARFVVECLDSIKNQTYNDYELIIMDDFSSDNSVEIIREWIISSGMPCKLILHEVNVGLCQTLNEAIGLSEGDFICMIATDDRWLPNRIEFQMELFLSLGPDVAVVYSDTAQIDESGDALPDTFLEGQRPGFVLPSGRVFEDLIDRNFVHPLAATIRKACILKVGGYDVRLVAEDYDMWLRLSNEYNFIYMPGIFSEYRIVSTSITRTLFSKPNIKFAYGQFVLAEKWIPSGLLNDDQRKAWCENQAAAAYWLYFHGDKRATHCLWVAFWRVKRFRYLGLAALSKLGIGRIQAKRVASVIGFGKVD